MQCWLVHLAATEQVQNVIPDHCLYGSYLKTSSDGVEMHLLNILHVTLCTYLLIYVTHRTFVDGTKLLSSSSVYNIWQQTTDIPGENSILFPPYSNLPDVWIQILVMSLPPSISFPINAFFLQNTFSRLLTFSLAYSESSTFYQKLSQRIISKNSKCIPYKTCL